MAGADRTEKSDSSTDGKAKAEEKPVVFILRGDDDFEINKFVHTLIARLGDPAMADLNTSRLEGRSTNEDALRSAALAMPFLADRRLVILNNPLALPSISRRKGESPADGEDSQPAENTRSAQARFTHLLDGLPSTTALVLVVHDSRSYHKGRSEWDLLTDNHWLMKWAHLAGKRVLLRDFMLPTDASMPEWVRKQTQALGGQMSPQAARALTDYMGCDTQAASQEILKLLTYVNFQRPIEEGDVFELTTPTNQSSVFELVDAIGEGRKRAVQLLHSLLEVSEAQELFAMINRQFRLILQAREVINEGGDADRIASELKLAPFLARKLAGQASRYSMPVLEQIYHRLLAMDLAAKTSQMSLETALDVFIAEIT